jgi:hypothetical protein
LVLVLVISMRIFLGLVLRIPVWGFLVLVLCIPVSRFLVLRVGLGCFLVVTLGCFFRWITFFSVFLVLAVGIWNGWFLWRRTGVGVVVVGRRRRWIGAQIWRRQFLALA